MFKKTNYISFHFSELVEGLTRAQRRLEDQRGTEINFELPDFLKDKENQQNSNPQQKLEDSKSNTRFYLEEAPVVHTKPEIHQIPSANYPKRELHAMYENRSLLVPDEQNQNHISPFKNNLRVTSTCDNLSAQSPSTKTSTSKMTGNKIVGGSSDPPPLPPKPKIIPIKPQNWGQLNGLNKFKDLKSANRNQAMFLEQPSSSFV